MYILIIYIYIYFGMEFQFFNMDWTRPSAICRSREVHNSCDCGTSWVPFPSLDLPVFISKHINAFKISSCEMKRRSEFTFL